MPNTDLVFDVNETLLDLSPLDAVFEALFSDAGARRRWFATLLHWSTVATLTGRFVPFDVLAGHCLDQTAAAAGRTLSADERAQVFDAVATLPPHDDVTAALGHLRRQGFRLVALTNSAQATVDAQFAHNKLTPYFDHVLSVEAARCYKPHPNAYAVATGTLGVRPERLRLIACHDWDITGAMRAGLHGAYVARNGGAMNAAGETPDIVGPNLTDVAGQIIERDG